MSRLGERLKELRGEQSLYEVEKQTGIRRNEVRRYEIGDYAPSSATLQKLAEYYDSSYEELRKYYYDDYFSDERERKIILDWAKQHN